MSKNKIEESVLFGEEFDLEIPKEYQQNKIKNERDLISFLKKITTVEEESLTPYKHKLGYYKKKGHYINGKKVNRYIYNYVKK